MEVEPLDSMASLLMRMANLKMGEIFNVWDDRDDGFLCRRTVADFATILTTHASRRPVTPTENGGK
jgi:hypothetical protein